MAAAAAEAEAEALLLSGDSLPVHLGHLSRVYQGSAVAGSWVPAFGQSPQL